MYFSHTHYSYYTNERAVLEQIRQTQQSQRHTAVQTTVMFVYAAQVTKNKGENGRCSKHLETRFVNCFVLL